MASVETNIPGNTNINLPEGNSTTRVQVVPGAEINLPFAPGDMAAKLGDNGNLAVQVNGQTIIFLGYAEANQASPVVLKAGG